LFKILLLCLFICNVYASGLSIEERAIRRVYSHYRKLSDGCDGKAVGFGGSLSPKSLAAILNLMKIVGRRVLDFGAQSAAGYELPGNIAQKFVFDAVILRMIITSPPKSVDCQWNAIDIDEVGEFCFLSLSQLTQMACILQMSEISNDFECVFSFWVGMTFATQLRILQISSACPTISTIAVFRDRKWPSPVEGTARPGLISKTFLLSNSS
jgi:hypothetical protein